MMMGFRALAETEDIVVDTDELEDAQWFTAAEIATVRRMGRRHGDLPPPAPRQHRAGAARPVGGGGSSGALGGWNRVRHG